MKVEKQSYLILYDVPCILSCKKVISYYILSYYIPCQPYLVRRTKFQKIIILSTNYRLNKCKNQNVNIKLKIFRTRQLIYMCIGDRKSYNKFTLRQKQNRWASRFLFLLDICIIKIQKKINVFFFCLNKQFFRTLCWIIMPVPKRLFALTWDAVS